MLQAIISQSGERLHRAFDREQTNQAARQAGWCQRRSKLEGFVFLKTLVTGFIEHVEASLNQLSQTCADLGVTISPQGLDERLNGAAVTFLQAQLVGLLGQLQARAQSLPPELAGFSEVYLQDSTVISLPASLQALYPGVGGAASSAALKVQLLFGLLSGQIRHLAVAAGTAADQSYSAHVAHLLPGSLLIQDLGFFNLALLQAVGARAAFFLSRWRTDVCVYAADGPNPRVDLPRLLRQQTDPVASYELRLGRQFRLPVRMICVRLPARVAAQRRRKAQEDARRRGRTLSERSLFWCDWNIFITNLPPERLSLPQILACYNLRWQVELIFKLWKSQAALDRLAGLRPERVLCELYAKLIGLVLTHFLVAPLRFLLLDQQIEISPPKARQILADRISAFAVVLGMDRFALETQLRTLVDRILRFARKTRRKTHRSALDRLRLADQLPLEHLFPLA